MRVTPISPLSPLRLLAKATCKASASSSEKIELLCHNARMQYRYD
jgi:hypothetical protein